MVVYTDTTNISTRGDGPYSFSNTIIEGLAQDGGLFVPQQYPRFSTDNMQKMRKMSYRKLAFEILQTLIDDIPAQVLDKMLKDTYNKANFGSDEITPLLKLDRNFYCQDLSNGPMFAFKDIPLQLLGRLFEYVLTQRNSYMNQLGATSGDTGSSAEQAARSRDRINIFMLSPFRGMSSFQTAQMYSILDSNTFNIAINGVFDDCQDMIKAVAEDVDFKHRHKLGVVNSINWGRVAAQIVYYFKGYFDATSSLDEQVDFAVPTGNFGDIFAGYAAKQMGLPIRRLILATNENNVLDEFFKTGIYKPRKRKDVVKTSSPSMDIAKASNFERYLFDISGRNPTLLASWMRQIEEQGFLDLSGTDYFKAVKDSGFVSGTSLHSDRINTIRKIYEEKHLIVDPHTADGIKVGLEYRDPDIPLICLSTAKPIKFEKTIKEALGFVPERPAELRDLEQRPQRFELMEIDTQALKAYIAKHAIKN